MGSTDPILALPAGLTSRYCLAAGGARCVLQWRNGASYGGARGCMMPGTSGWL